MADDTERLVLEMSADLKRFEKGLDRAVSASNRRLSAVEKRFEKAGQKMAGSMTSAASNVNRAIAGIAVGAAIREVGLYADAWTSAGNKLAAAGVQMDQVSGRQRELIGLANETRTSAEATIDLYAKLTRSTESLNATEQQTARATEIVNKAFKAGGAAASEQASGILQLGQALGSGVLQGDELRSLRENAPLVAKAIADEFETTVAGLKKLGEEGKLTSDRVFSAILNGGAAIDAQFARTTPTIADSFTILRNEAILFVGTLDKATGASKALSEFIVYVSQNLGALAAAAVIAASVLGGVLAGQAVIALIANLGRLAVTLGLTSSAFAAMGVRATLGAASMNALKLSMAFLGGPIGLAITAIAIALGVMTANAAAAKVEAQLLDQAIEDQAAAASTAAAEAANLSGELTATQSWAAALTNETDKLADAHYRAAAAAKAQAIEEARLRVLTAAKTLGEAQEAFRGRVRTENRRQGPSQGAGERGAAGGGALVGMDSSRVLQETARNAAVDSREYRNLTRQTATVVTETANLNRILAGELSTFIPKPFARTGGAAGGGGGGGSSGSSSAEAAAKEAESNRRSRVDIAARNALEVAGLRNDLDRIAVLEREEMLRGRVVDYVEAGVAAAQAQVLASRDQADYDAARRAESVRIVQQNRAALDLAIATTDQDFEGVRALERREELSRLIAEYTDAGLDTALATVNAINDQVRLEEARARAMARFMADEASGRRIRLAELAGEERLAAQLARAEEIRTRSRSYRDSGGMSESAATAQATAEVVEETRAQAQGAFRDAFRNGVLEAIQSGDVLGAIGDFALQAADTLTDRVLNQAADALFSVLSEQFPNLFDLGQELAASTAAAGTMGTAITTSGAAAGAAMAAAITGAGAAAAATIAAAIAAASTGSSLASVGSAFAKGFSGFKAGGGPARPFGNYIRNEKGAEPFVPTSSGVVFSNAAMRGLASLGKVASQGGGMGGDLKLEIINQTGVAAKAKAEKTPGGTKLTLQPMFEKALEGAGRSGSLQRAARNSPSPKTRG